MTVRVSSMPSQRRLLLVPLLLGLLGYVLPWAVAPSASMTLNAFDLAEWTSLYPAQVHTSPPLLAPLLLRAQLLILTLIFGLMASTGPWRALSAIVVLMLALAQLPPFEYVYDLANINYRQQFILALASLIGGLVALGLGRRRFARILLIALPLAGMATAYAGVSLAFDVYRQLQAVASIGLGPWLLLAGYAAIAASGLLGFRRNAEQAVI